MSELQSMASVLRSSIAVLVVSAALSVTAVDATAAGPDGSTKIPDMKGTSFTDQTVVLPKDLQGKAGILVVGFSQGSRGAITAWGKRLASDYHDSKEVAFYELPMLAGVPRFLRGMITGKIKASVSDRGKPHFVPVTENEAAWRTLTQYKSGDDAYVIVVDSAGGVRWQTHEGFSEAVYAAMKGQVESARSVSR